MNYQLTSSALTLWHKGKISSIANGNPLWDNAIKKLRDNDADGLYDLLNPAERIKSILATSTNGDIELREGVVHYQGKPLPSDLYVVRRLLEIVGDGLPSQSMVNFIENLMKNPSMRAVTELLGFLEYGNLPITEDGHFLAYKRINSDWTDCHTGRIDNSIGKVVEMPRNEVDDDSERTCSAGLHFCSKEYLRSFGGARLVALKIHPRDVVSIPIDYNNTKGRCCRYEVLAELEYDPNREDRLAARAVIDDPNQLTLDILDDDDNEEDNPTPKFDVGDLVIANGKPAIVLEYDENDFNGFPYRVGYVNRDDAHNPQIWFTACELSEQ